MPESKGAVACNNFYTYKSQILRTISSVQRNLLNILTSKYIRSLVTNPHVLVLTEKAQISDRLHKITIFSAVN